MNPASAPGAAVEPIVTHHCIASARGSPWSTPVTLREFHVGRPPRNKGIRFDPGCRNDAEFAPGDGRVLEQYGLADASFAVQDQHAAAPAAHFVEQMVEHVAFAFPAEQPAS